MKILEVFNSMAKDKFAHIGIGLGDSKSHNIKILKACLKFLKENRSKIYIFGKEPEIEILADDKSYIDNKNDFILVKSEEPEKESIKYLSQSKVNALIRGSLSSNDFLENIKKQFEVNEISRLALLETFEGFQFFYGPIGIDECNTLDKKQSFLNNAIREFNKFGIQPKISILSGGRKGDIGRDAYVDETLKVAKELVDLFKKENGDLVIFDDEILIEKAIERESNLILAPDGISGNLIYRTLVHLGSGNAYGAIYMGINKIIIDTSRVGKLEELKGALLLAIALSP
jgi:putative methanogen marker protein 4